MRKVFLCCLLILGITDAYAITIGSSVSQSGTAFDSLPTPSTSLNDSNAYASVTSSDNNLDINAERESCMSRANMYLGQFVWASRNSDVSNYAFMTEDVNHPENNACFVKVSVQHSDVRINTNDLPYRFFELGKTITCGDWLSEDDLESRVLAAGKKRRIGGVVAATLGGAGLGVGVSEGAMAIAAKKGSDSKLLGQKALDDREFLISHIKKLQKENQTQYNKIMKALEDLDTACDSNWACTKPADCDNSNPFRNLKESL